ncbi:MAG: NUDIX domain-containing protein [Candidatus Paceibacterota bacterium]|jgi:8-oxo-dGTP diphosphatase
MDRPKVSVVTIIRRDNKLLLGLRHGSAAGAGMWGFTGGHLEGGESFEQCAIREVAEETGIKLKHVTYFTIENVIFEAEQKHYVTIFMVGDVSSDQEATNMEPTKCINWEWFSWDELPSPLVPGIAQFIKRGQNPFEVW